MKCQGQLKYSSLFIVIFFIATSLLVTACSGGAQAQETFTIGVINYLPPLEQTLDGFKAEMAELGYIEGENVTYIYHGAIEPNPTVLNAEIENLLTQDVDLLFTMGNPTTLAARQAVEGTGIPVIFAPVVNPVGDGMVESIAYPGGNLTGIQNITPVPKAVELLLKLVPETTKLYVPYHPDDEVSVASIAPLPEAARTLGIELMLDEVRSPEEVLAAIETLPDDAAILLVTVPSLEPVSPFFNLATERGLAVGSASNGAEVGALIVYTTDLFAIGKQAARLADQVFRGIAPSQLPVETGQFFLSINLQTAAALGLEIPEEVLLQANDIIR
jgi:putative ABC transport system substrate-binding protein